MIAWTSAEFHDHEQVCCFHDQPSGLKAIIAIHSTALGPAAGGTRFWAYAEDRLALDDALRLSRAMSYKWALAGIACGGGKAVIIGDPLQLKTRKLLHAYGHFLNRIGSTYCTGGDVGFSMDDCQIVREVSPFVAGTASAAAGDLATHTATGVFHGLVAIREARFGGESFDGMHIAVQGLGKVGWHLCEQLHAAGALLTVTDIRSDVTARAVERFGARSASPEEIHRTKADVFAPCALGGVINRETVDTIGAVAIGGAANNQLESAEIGAELHRRGILFAPDYVINAGGIIAGAEELAGVPGRRLSMTEPLEARLRNIRGRLRDIFSRSATDDAPPDVIAQRMARELIGRAQASS